MINPNSDRAGGWPTPLKNDGLRQLGWWFFPRLMDKSSSHVPVTTKQFPILPWPLWGDPIFSCAQGGWRWLVLEPPVPSLLMSGMKVWLFFNPNGVYTYIYIYLFNFIYTPKFSCQLRGVFSSVPAQELTRWRNCTCNLLMTAARMSARTCQLRNRWISSGQHPSLEPVFPIAACCNAHTWTRLLLNILLNHGFLPAHCSMWLFQMWMATGRID